MKIGRLMGGFLIGDKTEGTICIRIAFSNPIHCITRDGFYRIRSIGPPASAPCRGGLACAAALLLVPAVEVLRYQLFMIVIHKFIRKLFLNKLRYLRRSEEERVSHEVRGGLIIPAVQSFSKHPKHPIKRPFQDLFLKGFQGNF